MLDTVRSEQVKFTSTAGTYVAAALFVLLSLAYGLANAYLVDTSAEGYRISNVGATAGIQGFGITVLTVLAALFVTQEYRYKTILLSFQATPTRSRVLVAKALVVTAFAVVLSAGVALVAIPAAALVADPAMHRDLGLGTAGGTIGAIVACSAAASVLAVGIGALTRSTAAAVAIVVIWPSVVEMLVKQMPGIGAEVAPFLPFENAYYAMTGRASGTDFLWGQWGALAYFAAVSLTVLAVAAAQVGRSDA